MNKTAVKLISALLIVLFPYPLMGQQTEAPLYEDGDWWKVKIEFDFKYGYNRSGECYESYPEYLVKIEQGNPKVYGISGAYQEEIDCPEIKDEVLGKGRSKRLKFPLNLGLTWTGRGIREEDVEMRRGFITVEVDYDIDHKVLAWEKVQTLKGVYDAFKITESRYENYGSTYFYSPTVKAIVLQVANLEWVDRKVILVDFSLESDRKRLEAPEIAKQLEVAPPPQVVPPPQVAKPRRVTLPPIPQRGGKRFAEKPYVPSYELTGPYFYKSLKCASCHGKDGKGQGPAAKAMKLKASDWTDQAAMGKLTDDFLNEIITKGGKAVNKSNRMPAYSKKLIPAEVADLVAYVRSFAK